MIQATFVYIQIPFITTTSQTSYPRLPQYQVTHPLPSWGYGLHHIHFGQVQPLHHLLGFLLERSAMKLLWRWRWCQESNLEFFLWCATLAQKRVGFSWESLVGYIKSATSPWEGRTSKHKLDNSLHYRNKQPMVLWDTRVRVCNECLFFFPTSPSHVRQTMLLFSTWCYAMFRWRTFVANPVCRGQKETAVPYLKSMCPPCAEEEVFEKKSKQTSRLSWISIRRLILSWLTSLRPNDLFTPSNSNFFDKKSPHWLEVTFPTFAKGSRFASFHHPEKNSQHTVQWARYLLDTWYSRY